MRKYIESENNVEIRLDIKSYNEIIQKAKMFELLVSAMYETASLSWDKKRLTFDDSFLNAFLCGIDNFDYNSHIALLNELEKEKVEDAEAIRRIKEQQHEEGESNE